MMMGGDEKTSGQYAAPGTEQVFGRLDSEEALQERLRQEDKQEQFRPGDGRPSAQATGQCSRPSGRSPRPATA